MKAKVSLCRATGVAALACLVGLTGAAAAELHRDQEERGFYLGISLLRDQISNLDFDLATNTAGGEGARLRLERSSEVRYDIGWLLPERRGGVGITYWEYMEKQDSEDSSQPAIDLLPTSFLDSAVTRSDVESEVDVVARSVDFAYSRDFKLTDNFHASWVLGLRYFRYEHRLEALYTSASRDLAIEEVESTGVGPRVGAGFHYNFTPRLGLGGSLGVATLFGDTDTGNVSVRLIGAAGEIVTFNETHNLSQTFNQMDMELYVSYVAWRTLEVRGGLRVAHWHDARARELFGPDDIFESERVTFDGPYLRVGYRF